jgi:hypothetical protein
MEKSALADPETEIDPGSKSHSKKAFAPGAETPSAPGAEAPRERFAGPAATTPERESSSKTSVREAAEVLTSTNSELFLRMEVIIRTVPQAGETKRAAPTEKLEGGGAIWRWPGGRPVQFAVRVTSSSFLAEK